LEEIGLMVGSSSIGSDGFVAEGARSSASSRLPLAERVAASLEGYHDLILAAVVAALISAGFAALQIPASNTVRAESPAPPLPQEWRWGPDAVSYEHMYRTPAAATPPAVATRQPR